MRQAIAVLILGLVIAACGDPPPLETPTQSPTGPARADFTSRATGVPATAPLPPKAPTVLPHIAPAAVSPSGMSANQRIFATGTAEAALRKRVATGTATAPVTNPARAPSM